MTGGALLLCFHVFFVVTVSLCADHVILRTLKIRSFNVCGIINNMISVLNFFGTTVSTTARECLAFRLKEGGCMELGRVFDAYRIVCTFLTVVFLVLTRATKL